MFTRKVVTVSAAAFALVALSVPVVNAQGDGTGTDGAGAGSLPLGSLEAGGLGAGSLADGSADSGADSTDEGPGDEGDAGEGDDSGSLGGGSLGSLDGVTGEDSSLGELAPESGAVCQLPGLGGSVAKFYPLLGIEGVPTGVLDLITTALDSFPNLLDVVGGEGGGTASLEEAGSLADGLCETFLGGELALPPVTVIVDGDGVPVSTVTGTVAPRGSATTSTLTAAAETGDEAGSQESGAPVSAAGQGAGSSSGAESGESVPTTVPVP